MNTKVRRPKSRPETLERRKEILKAALATFGSKGYKSGPLTEIAEQVNMTHAGILHHFGSKDQLLLEVLRYRDVADLDEFEDRRIPGGMGMFRHLERTAVRNAERAGIVQAYAVLSAESVTDDHPARAYFEERYRVLRSELADAFREVCAERGTIPPESIAPAAASILAVMDGLQVQWLLDPESLDLGAVTAFAIEAIVAAVLGAAPEPLTE